MILALLGAALAAPQDLTLRATDGTSVHVVAELVPKATKGAVLVHMVGRDASDWQFFAEKLVRSGFSTAAPDLRGHGRTAAPGPEITEADWKASENDVRAAIDALRAKGVTDISCIGASIGANLCLRVAAADPGIVNLVLLSPGLNYKGVTAVDALPGYGDRPLLIVVSEEDQFSLRTANVLEQKAAGQHHVMLLKDAGHGTKMLNRDAKVEGELLAWLLGSFKLASGEVVVPRPATGQADLKKVETTGEKLDSHK
jgi:pimeloyl-ACP methyl ester carboxylesterase